MLQRPRILPAASASPAPAALPQHAARPVHEADPLTHAHLNCLMRMQAPLIVVLIQERPPGCMFSDEHGRETSKQFRLAFPGMPTGCAYGPQESTVNTAWLMPYCNMLPGVRQHCQALSRKHTFLDGTKFHLYVPGSCALVLAGRLHDSCWALDFYVTACRLRTCSKRKADFEARMLCLDQLVQSFAVSVRMSCDQCSDIQSRRMTA